MARSIGVFNSGFGGLAVLKRYLKSSPTPIFSISATLPLPYRSNLPKPFTLRLRSRQVPRTGRRKVAGDRLQHGHRRSPLIRSGSGVVGAGSRRDRAGSEQARLASRERKICHYWD